jgi:hypothetical protein
MRQRFRYSAVVHRQLIDGLPCLPGHAAQSILGDRCDLQWLGLLSQRFARSHEIERVKLKLKLKLKRLKLVVEFRKAEQVVGFIIVRVIGLFRLRLLIRIRVGFFFIVTLVKRVCKNGKSVLAKAPPPPPPPPPSRCIPHKEHKCLADSKPLYCAATSSTLQWLS